MTDAPHVALGRDLPWLLRSQAAARGDAAFVTYEPLEGESRTFTYADFATEVGRVAAGLRDAGLQPGDRLLVHLDNCPEFLLVWFACAAAGIVAVTTNTRAADEELAYFVRRAHTRAAVCGAAYAERLQSISAAHLWTCPVREVPPGRHDLEQFTRAGSIAALPPEPMRHLGIQFTSGTTSRPKGVIWTHANALWAAQVGAAHEDLRASDVHLTFLPLFHTNALSYSVLASLWVGAHVVLQPRFSARRFWRVALKHRCTWASMIPFVRRALAEQPVPEHRFRLWGTAVCAPPDDDAFRVKTLGWWGMTETLTHCVVGSPHHENASMSMGRPAPEYDVHVVDDDGRDVAPGETGELRIAGVRGVSLFAGYLDDPEATAGAFDAQGRLRTGDRVRLATDGFLYFADRAKDMLKVGGENVAASEVERVIAQVPGVVECAVVGRPDPMLAEVPVAFVIAAGGADLQALAAAVRTACDERLADFKVPREIAFVDELPRSTLNKVAKAELRVRAAELGAHALHRRDE